MAPDRSEDMARWVDETIKEFEALQGRKLLRLVARERALLDEDADGMPRFDDPSVPLVQADPFYLGLDNYEMIAVATYQNDSSFGLVPHWTPVIDRRDLEVDIEPESLWRVRELHGFPTGKIDGVAVSLDCNGDISEVVFCVAGCEMVLVAGTVYQKDDGSIEVVRGDEEVLAFRTSKDLSRIRFTPPHEPPELSSFERAVTFVVKKLGLDV